MIAESVALSLALAAAPTDVRTVSAPDSPVRLAHATALSGADGPPVVLYEASNPGDDQLDEFTVIVYVFRDGVLKARQTAPGRRTLDARSEVLGHRARRHSDSADRSHRDRSEP